MKKSGPPKLLCSMLFVGSFFLGGCKTDENKVEDLVTKSSSSPHRLTASLKAIDSSETPETNTSVVFFIKNDTGEDKKLLIWNTPVEQPLSADVFSVQHNGKDLDYQGRMIKRSSPLPKHFRTLESGETIESVVDISIYYDMSQPGAYTVSLDPAVIDGTQQMNAQTQMSFVPKTLILTVH